MPVLLGRLLKRLALTSNWATPLIVALFVFATSWPLMVLAEGARSGSAIPSNT